MSKIEEALLEYEKQDYKKAYILFNEYRKESSEKDFDRYYSYKFIKTIYEVKIKHMKNLDADIQKDIIYIIKHSDFNALFYKITIFKTVELLENKNNVNWKDILIWLKKLDLNSLSSKKNIFEIEGKKIEMFSEIEKYFRKLKKEIKELKLSYQDRKKGFIATINEKYCFIESNGNRYFCQIKEFPKNLNLVKGLNVEFTLVESFDKKKNKLSYAAKDIKILEENNID